MPSRSLLAVWMFEASINPSEKGGEVRENYDPPNAYQNHMDSQMFMWSPVYPPS